MLERNNKSGVSRIVGYKDRYGSRQNRYENKSAAYDKEIERKMLKE